MRYAIIAALLLAGCATVPDTPAPAPRHHRLALKAPAMAVAAPVAVAPAVSTPAPVTKQTFRQRWLSKFFRSRAQ